MKDTIYYLQKIIQASDGPLMAEMLADECSQQILKKRDGKKNFFKSKSKSIHKEEMEYLELAIAKIMRQATDDAKELYQMVLDRIHVTGMDPLFTGPVPQSIFKKNVSSAKSLTLSPESNV